MNLKSSYLLSESLLFENEFIFVYCKSNKQHAKSQTISLTFSPKCIGLMLTVKTINAHKVSLKFGDVKRKALVNEFKVTVVNTKLESFDPLDFPELSIVVHNLDFNYEFRIQVPFSINKSSNTIRAKIDQCLEYLEYVV